MAFPEAMKAAMRKRAHLSCCLCHEIGVEIHHIVPQAEGGPDTEDNAAPLCPNCHERYGANPEKRKFIREAREMWFEICAQRFAPEADRLASVERSLNSLATKADLENVRTQLSGMLSDAMNDSSRSVQERAKAMTHINTIVTSGIGVNRMCRQCGTAIGLFVGDQGKCPSCGAPW